nr:hypothetical protein B0A51_08697 [Rachicladosporium sp. CCFEE 5018]
MLSKLRSRLRSPRGLNGVKARSRSLDEVIVMGFELKSGVATVLRLQTFWGLVPAEHAGAAEEQSRDSVEYRKLRASESKARSKWWAKERAAAAEAAKVAEGRVHGGGAAVVHYPTNFWAWGTVGGEWRGWGSDGFDRAATVSHVGTSTSIAPIQESLPAFSYTRDIMSANLMVDLAISMLSAANDVKDLMIAGEIRRPATNSITGLPPSHEEVISAKRKLKEATRCAWDLAKDGVLGDM